MGQSGAPIRSDYATTTTTISASLLPFFLVILFSAISVDIWIAISLGICQIILVPCQSMPVYYYLTGVRRASSITERVVAEKLNYRKQIARQNSRSTVQKFASRPV